METRAHGVRVVQRGDKQWLNSTHIILVSNHDDIARVLAHFDLTPDAIASRAASSVDACNLASFVDSKQSKTRCSSSSSSSSKGKKKRQDVRVVIQAFNWRLPYNSLRTIARLVSSIGGDVCVHAQHVPPTMHVPLMHVIGKHCYTFSKYRTSQKHGDVDVRTVHAAESQENAQNRNVWIMGARVNDALLDAQNSLEFVDVARDLENEPANHMTPERFCARARSILRKSSKFMKTKVLGVEEMRAEGMGLVLSVGMSSAHPPRFLITEWIKDPGMPTICLVGKGVTFDTGGLRLKSAQGMLDMKQDKSGAALVIAIMCHIAKYHPELPVNLVGLMPMVENAISGSATKPGDIVTAHNGRNVEILDPDAEGRLIIADAISYSGRYSPDYVIDFATLTSFASNICCDLSAVFYARDDKLSKLIYDLGEATGERVWRHPPWDEYHHNTISPVADMRNAGFECTRSGSFMAAMFISNFVPRGIFDRWVHFDIANNDVRGIHSANCAFLGMELVKSLAKQGWNKKARGTVQKKEKKKV